VKKTKIIFILFFLFLFLVFFGCPNPIEKKDTKPENEPDTIPENGPFGTLSENFGPTESWTFMIYMDADNNLEQYAIDDFTEIVRGLNGLGKPNIKVVVLIDRISGYNDTNFLGESSNWDGARIYQMNQNNTFTKKTNGWFTDGAEINMGDPNTLKNFINYCKTNYPSQHYALILWNHGGGARSRSYGSSSERSSVKAVCWDDTNGRDCLYLDEVQQAVSQYFNSSNKLDFIGFDACLMATVEVAYEFRDLAKVMAGSMALEWGYGWDYKKLFQGMKDGSSNDAIELGKLVVKQYKESTISQQTDQTQSAIDLSKIGALKTALDNLAVAIYNENKKSSIESLRDLAYHFYRDDEESIDYPYYDIYSLCAKLYNNLIDISDNLKLKIKNVIDNLKSAVIAAYAGSKYGNYYGVGSDVKRGLSIFFSRGNLTYNNLSHYAYQWWYTSEDTNAWRPGEHCYYGYIDFANSDTDGIVETWRELMEAWYDPGQSDNTPGKY